jgi:hypothetical protein
MLHEQSGLMFSLAIIFLCSFFRGVLLWCFCVTNALVDMWGGMRYMVLL